MEVVLIVTHEKLQGCIVLSLQYVFQNNMYKTFPVLTIKLEAQLLVFLSKLIVWGELQNVSNLFHLILLNKN